MKYKELVKLIENISLHIPNINSFYIGDVYEINSDPTVKYSTVVLTNQESTFSVANEQYTYNFVLFYIDRLSDDEKNRLDIQSHAIDALSNILEILNNSYNCIIDNYRFEVFQERFADLCSGAFARVSVVVDEMDCIESFKIISENDLKSIAINRNGEYNGLYNKVIVDVPAPYFRTKHLEVTENNKLYVASDEGLDGYESVNVNVPEPSIEENRIVIEPANGTYKITPTDGHDAMKEVSLTVAVPNPALTNLSVTENGTYEAVDSGYYGFASVSVDVPQPRYNSGELVARENGVYRASNDGYDGYYAVLVDVPQSSSAKWIIPDGMKFQASKAIDTSLFDTSNMIDMSWMLSQLHSGVTSLDLTEWDTSNVTNMEYMFYQSKYLDGVLDVSAFDTSKVTNMAYLFSDCENITSIEQNFNTSAVTDMKYMFSSNYKIENIDISNWNVSNVLDCYFMFGYCPKLKSINISNLQFNSDCDWSFIFNGCSALTDIITNENTVLPACNNNPRLPYTLTVASIVNLLNALPEVTTTKTFTIGADNLAKLSDAQKAIATAKNWTLA